eukprot:TRINITY_DN23989_c0_g1_i1.p3 TRINITY_DN23989_c0_g1~~TRINITY_DN23989_c0_g1_i1.p3  ORF type:complete len:114 (+),score=17.05 TRINITY_DN23989_c0_g1_i1:468-809(+)
MFLGSTNLRQMKKIDGNALLQQTINVLSIVLIIINLVISFFWICFYKNFEFYSDSFQNQLQNIQDPTRLQQNIIAAVSYTHLTLPTKRIVQIPVVAGSIKKQVEENQRNIRKE